MKEKEKEGTIQQWHSMGSGLEVLPKKLVERIRANEYIDFTELPPAKGKDRPVPQSLEGQVIVVQAADLVQSRKIIPDLATWTQCFALYVATLASHRLLDLMAYQALMAKASLKFRWPSWIVYDQNFRQEAAGNPHQVWAKADPAFTHNALPGKQSVPKTGAANANAWIIRQATARTCPGNVPGALPTPKAHIRVERMIVRSA